jgi:uncharacterized Zn-binding protein involved in type VI secretion
MPEAARLGDLAECKQCKHGCPGCPHPTVGLAVKGSPNVKINGRPAFREGDAGFHAACCGPNTWVAKKGSGTVKINGQPAMRKDDQTTHCGGDGKMILGSDDVKIGG